MNGISRGWLIWSCFGLLLMAGHGLRAAEVRILAAASLSDALKEAGAACGKETGHRIVFQFGASSTLARQIGEGARGDIFFSADEAWMDVLEKGGHIVPETRRSRLSNTLVVVVPAEGGGGIHRVEDLADPRVKRVALADPQAVPAGVYARKYLEERQLWRAIGPKVVPAENVRAALAAVESGNVEAGVVYKTDVTAARKVRIACEIPGAQGLEIRYPSALLRESRFPDAARRVLEWLDGAGARAVFVRHGFLIRD